VEGEGKCLCGGCGFDSGSNHFNSFFPKLLSFCSRETPLLKATGTVVLRNHLSIAKPGIATSSHSQIPPPQILHTDLASFSIPPYPFWLRFGYGDFPILEMG
jgi:hypothetical protein